jgi:Acyl-CoA synthetase (NDP forming)
MLRQEVQAIISTALKDGWIMEPEAKRLFSLEGLSVPRHFWAKTPEEALSFAGTIGYPVVVKVVSPLVIHKSEAGGVLVGVAGEEALRKAFDGLSRIEGFQGVLVEEMVGGIELIAGAKIDYQFGPVILLGLGGTATEVYQDVALRLPPLAGSDVVSMIQSLRGHRLLEGFRGAEPINMERLTSLVLGFSRLVMDLEEYIESIDLNPIIANARNCVVADARIILKKQIQNPKL